MAGERMKPAACGRIPDENGVLGSRGQELAGGGDGEAKDRSRVRQRPRVGMAKALQVVPFPLLEGLWALIEQPLGLADVVRQPIAAVGQGNAVVVQGLALAAERLSLCPMISWTVFKLIPFAT